MLKAVLFDLDGTLLPMDQDIFITAYLDAMAKKMEPHGYDPQLLTKAIWRGTAAMAANIGDKTNEAVFWENFCGVFGSRARIDEPIFREFYENEFQQVANACGFSPEAGACITQIHKMGLRTVLATNPLFPAIATHSRVRWAGLQVSDFELITTYENSCHCKPNPEYYRDILEMLNLSAADCIMVGNDATEDLIAKNVGISVFLLTDCLINKENRDITQIPQGGFEDLMQFIREKMV